MTSAPRAAVYNRFWRSQGGGERHSGMIAQVLAQAGWQVDLLGHEEFDVHALGEHLHIDLDSCTPRVLPEVDDVTLGGYTAEYDLFVNGSYTSRIPAQAAKSAYLCYFPTPAGHDLSRWRLRTGRMLRRFLGETSPLHLTWGLGWYPPEGGRRRTWQWTSGAAELSVAPGPPLDLHLEIGRPGMAGTDLVVTVDGEVVLQTTVQQEFQSHAITVPAAADVRTLHFASPVDHVDTDDNRTLGVAVSRLRVAGSGFDVRTELANRMPWVARSVEDLGFLDSYDVIFANSAYTRDWIRRLWHRDSTILYPPIEVDSFVPESTRAARILIAGRFFAPNLGHSKRQLEQVELFSAMVAKGLLEGWELYVVGGCEPSQRPYVDRVRAAGFNAPVEVITNAPRAQLIELMSTSSIVWSATGYGEDEWAAPWANEHFGMTTVEAMAGGCVPVVIDRAGQREIVRQNIDGYRWSTLQELAQRTLVVVTDDAKRRRMSLSSVARSRLYSDEAFTSLLVRGLDQIGLNITASADRPGPGERQSRSGHTGSPQ